MVNFFNYGMYYAGIFFWGFLETWVVFGFCKNILGIKEEYEKSTVWIAILTMLILFCIPEDGYLLHAAVLVFAMYQICRGGKAQRVCVALHGAFIIFYSSYLRLLFVYKLNMGYGDLAMYYWFSIPFAMAFGSFVITQIGEACKELDESSDGWLYAGVCLVNYLMLWLFCAMIKLGYDTRILTLMFVVISVFALVDYVLLINYQGNIRKVKAMRKLSEFQKKSELEQEHFKRLEEVYGEFRGLAHDMKHYLGALSSMSGGPEMSAVQFEVTEEIKARIQNVGQEFYCMRPVLNALLNEKEKKARESGVELEVFVETGFDFDNLDDYALIGIVSNLVDNALEAAVQCEGKKWAAVRLFAVNDGKQKFLRVENTQIYKEEIQTKNFFTTKKNKDHHGYGLKNVEKLVDENRGILRLKSEGDRFLAEAVFG